MINAIVTDIEGTITRIEFVKEILFPYARAKMAEFILNEQDKPEVASQILAVKSEMANADATIDEVIKQLVSWIDQDLKVTPLKQLQGMIWQYGYQQGDFTGHLYPDAQQFLEQQHKAIKLYVYSSGSVQAQQLLFQYSDYGDVRYWFDDYFDTRIGHKRDVAAYQHIIEQINQPASTVLFLSDVVEELDAAAQAGMKTCQLYRDGQPYSDLHPKITSFEQLNLGDFV